MVLSPRSNGFIPTKSGHKTNPGTFMPQTICCIKTTMFPKVPTLILHSNAAKFVPTDNKNRTTKLATTKTFNIMVYHRVKKLHCIALQKLHGLCHCLQPLCHVRPFCQTCFSSVKSISCHVSVAFLSGMHSKRSLFTFQLCPTGGVGGRGHVWKWCAAASRQPWGPIPSRKSPSTAPRLIATRQSTAPCH